MTRLPSHTGLGTSSILTIMTAVLLVVFSALSILSANNDLKLTERTIDETKAYYEAEAKAQAILEEAGALNASGSSPLGVKDAGIYETDGGYAFKVDISANKWLEVEFTAGADGIKVQRHVTAARPAGEGEVKWY